jgi:hypothetical protein
MSDDWDTKTVIGFKKQIPKVAKKEADINGTSPSLSSYTVDTNHVFSRKYSHAKPFFTPHTFAYTLRLVGLELLLPRTRKLPQEATKLIKVRPTSLES